MHINGYPLILGIILEAWAFVSWHYKSAKSGKVKPPAWRLCIGGFLLTIGFPMWLDSLASVTATRIGLAVLVVVTLVLLWMFWHEAIRGRNRHPIRTPVVGWLFADALFLSIASIGRIVSHAKHLAPSTGHAIAATMSQIRSGHAATMMPTSEAVPWAVGGLVTIAVIIMVAHRVHRAGSASGGGGKKGGGKAINGGKGKKGSAKALSAAKGS